MSVVSLFGADAIERIAREQEVERVARALCINDPRFRGGDPDAMTQYGGEMVPIWNLYVDSAIHAIRLIREG